MRQIIYLWCAPIGNSGDVIGYAMTQDGQCIASHLSSNPDWSKRDMGLNSNLKHDVYLKYCPNGYSLAWLDNPESDEGWKRALELNKQRAPAAIRADAARRETPTLAELKGIAPDAIGDLSSEEFIGKLRSEWDTP